MRILIADADAQHLEILNKYLKRRGHEVKIASVSWECTFELRDFGPDVLVLDRELPWAGEVMTEICGDRSFDGIPIIVISDVDPRVIPVGVEGGCFADWLPKPFSLTVLLERIRFVGRDHSKKGRPICNGGFRQSQNGLTLDFQTQKS
jgi:DNA-binding response OmpR family regulator